MSNGFARCIGGPDHGVDMPALGPTFHSSEYGNPDSPLCLYQLKKAQRENGEFFLYYAYSELSAEEERALVEAWLNGNSIQ